jgi:hypothetical protein
LKRPQQERDREAAIEEARVALASYEKELAPRTAELARKQAEETAKAEADLKAYEATLPAKLAEWEKKQSTAVRWVVLEPKSMKDSNGATLTREPDGSILVSGSDEPGAITVVAETDLTGLTGFRLEVLSDDRLPLKGPGRSPDGNFVLNEFQVTSAPKAEPKKPMPIALQNASADFSQLNFSVKLAIDGQPGGQKGWAVSPSLGVIHWATFETKAPVGGEGGTSLTFQLQHRYAKGFMPGRFRLLATRVPRPVGLDLPEEYRSIVAVSPEIRTQVQKDTLLAYFRSVDPQFRTKSEAYAKIKAPLPMDARLKELRDQLEFASRPVAADPQLAQLRRDVEMSIQQSAVRRLTAAQDIAWALINSPAFLFNH